MPPLKPKLEHLLFQTSIPDIQKVIDNARAGETVFVKDGTYNVTGYQALTIDKPINLIGQDKHETIIVGINWHLYSYGVIHLETDNASISGFTIDGNVLETGISLEGRNCKITGNIIENCSFGGIWLSASGVSNVINNNNITSNGFYGILLESYDSIISENNIIDNQGIGLELNSQNVTVTQNAILRNGISPKTLGVEASGGLN